MSQEPAARQPLEPAAADAVRAYAARTRADADRFASALEDIAANGLPHGRGMHAVGGTARGPPRPPRSPAPGRRLMTGRRRAQIAFSDSAAKQLENLTDEHQIHALDRALVAISVDPEIGEPIPGDTTHPELRQYADEIERVRVLYFVTALRTVVVVAYIEA